MRKFCPSCGKKTANLYKNLCISCFTKRTKIIEINAKISAIVCPCGSVKINNRWVHFKNMNDLIEKVVEKNSETPKKVRLSVDYSEVEIGGKTTIPLIVRALMEIDNKKVIEEKKVELKIEKQLCPNCSKIKGGYFEAILQLRGDSNIVMKIGKIIIKKVNEHSRKNKFSFITKMNKIKSGIDIYIGSYFVANKIVNEIKKIYNIETKKSYTLYGIKQGKKMYRVTILIRVI